MYYLHNTSYRIVFCNNSGEDISYKIHDAHKRIEFLTYKGNDFDRSLGKGYGEFRIMQFAFENSQFIKAASYIIKVTGKLKVLNIKENLRLVFGLFGYRDSFLVVKRFPPPVSGSDSRCFVVNPFFLHLFLYGGGEKNLNDEKGYYFEHLLFKSVEESRKLFFLLDFPLPLQIDGYSWTDGEKYYLPVISNVSKLKIIIDYIDDIVKKIDEGSIKLRLVLIRGLILFCLPFARMSNFIRRSFSE